MIEAINWLEVAAVSVVLVWLGWQVRAWWIARQKIKSGEMRLDGIMRQIERPQNDDRQSSGRTGSTDRDCIPN